MKHPFIITLSSLIFILGAYTLPESSIAQLADVRTLLNSVHKSRIVFPRGRTSINIRDGINNIYIFRANAGQFLTLRVNALGGRASVMLYSVNGKPLSPDFNGSEGEGKSFSLRLNKTGDYYIFGYSGPTNHFYNFTLSIK